VLGGPGGDIVVVDENPDLNVSTALTLIGEINQDIPVMVVTDRPDVQATVMQSGARDVFEMKDLGRLRPAIEREYQATQVRVALRQLQAQYQLLVEKVPAGIHLIALDRHNSTLSISPQLESLLGFSQAEWQADPQLWREHLHPEDRERVLAGWSALFAPGAEPFIAEYRWVTGSGQVVWLRDETVLVRDASGRPHHLQSTKLDITERKQVEAEAETVQQNLSVWVAELEQHNREITLLNEMSNKLQSCHTMEEAYTVVSDFLTLLFPAESGALFALSPSRATLEAVAQWGQTELGEPVFAPDECWALRQGRLYVVVDPRTERVCPHLGPEYSDSYLCVPLTAQGETLGILHLQRGQPQDAEAPRQLLTEAKQQLAVTVVEHVAPALANLKMRETLRLQSNQDPLTGLFNRRYLDETLERELRRANRKQRALSLIRFEVDDLRQFSSTFGPEAGDMLLRQVSAWLQKQVRGEDVVGRYSNEDFLLILPDTPASAAEQRAELLREAFTQLPVEYSSQIYTGLTLATAIANFPEHGATAEELLRLTDTYLATAAVARAERKTGPLAPLGNVPSVSDAPTESQEAALPTPDTPARLMVRDLVLDLQTFELTVGDKMVRPTPVEFDLLQFLMRNAGKVFTSENLLREVWHYPPGTGSHESVRAHIKNLRAKIEPDPSHPIYLKTLGRFGYTVPLEEPSDPPQS
jgi:diguanylate cyclase (GGDEF)-like protein/PAS domain S-box-containing protein